MEGKQYSDLLNYVSKGSYPDDLYKVEGLAKRKSAKRLIRQQAKGLIIKDGMLYHDTKRVLRRNEVNGVLATMHAGKHD